MMRTVTLILTLLVSANAFLAPTTPLYRTISSDYKSAEAFGLKLPKSAVVRTSWSSSNLSVKKSPSEERPELDYGMIVGMFFNPLNPYAWFVYLFSFIIIFGTINGH